MQHSGSLIVKKMKEKTLITVNFFQDDTVVLFIVICSLSFIWDLLFDILDFRLAPLDLYPTGLVRVRVISQLLP